MKSIYSLSILIIFHFISGKTIQAQGENDQWIFGNSCHVSFKNGTPQVLAPLNTLKTLEGCSSVSDKYGNLLFYSDGITVWNKNHGVMQNGTGLKGDPSSTSSCVVVPIPRSPNLYYLFCVQSNMSNTHLLTYNILDINANAGLGKIIKKNAILVENSDEKIAVTKNCSNNGFWLVMHKALSNEYLSFSIDSSGINISPVSSFQNISVSKNIELGYLKFSTDGNYLANAQCHGRTIELYKFDKQTGRVTYFAHETLPMGDDQTFYGLSFSPNNGFLYTSLVDRGAVFQFNLNQDPKQIFKNGILVLKSPSRIGALQLGKDNKLYTSNSYSSNALNCILFPEELGLKCQPILNYLKLNTKSHIGLPTYVESLDNYFSLGKDSIIDYHKKTLSANYKNAQYLWSTGQTTESIIIDRSGMYWITITDFNKCILIRDTIEINLLRYGAKMKPLTYDTLSVCSGNTITFPKFESDSPNIRFYWTNDNPKIGLAKSGWGQIKEFIAPNVTTTENARIVIYPKADTARGKPQIFKLTIKSKVILERINSYTICAGDSLTKIIFKSNLSGCKIDWYTNNTSFGLTAEGKASIPAFKSLEIENNQTAQIQVIGSNNSCPSDTLNFEINVLGLPKIIQEKNLEFCAGEKLNTIVFKSSTNGAKFKWFNNNNSIGIPDSGSSLIQSQYTLNASTNQHSKITVYSNNGKCKSQAMQFDINIKSRPIIDTIKPMKFCSGDSLPKINFTIKNQFDEINWENDNPNTGIPTYGMNFISAKKLKDLEENQTSNLKVEAKNGLCYSDPMNFSILSIAKPRMNNSKMLKICAGQRIEEIELKCHPQASNISWIYGDSIYGEFKSGTQNIPSIQTYKSQKPSHFKIICQADYLGCKSDTAHFDLIVNPVPKPLFTLQVSDLKDGKIKNEIKTSNRSIGATYYTWHWGDQESSEDFEPTHIYAKNSAYTVKLYAENGYNCFDTLSQNIKFFKYLQYYIPNAFSPDQNGKNESFHIYGVSDESASFEIFNRWGEKLFETANNTAWNGTFKDSDCQADIYIYKAKIVSKEGKLIELSGTLSLLR
jgi:gliding motility-associated-like protein